MDKRKWIKTDIYKHRFFTNRDIADTLYGVLSKRCDNHNLIYDYFCSSRLEVILNTGIGSIEIDGKIASYKKFKKVESDDEKNVMGYDVLISAETFSMKIGKFIKNVLGINYNQNEIDSIIGLLTCDIDMSVVRGEDIRRLYHEDMYELVSGTLGNSCMRYSSCQSYFDVYVKTPGCSMVVIRKSGETNKILGRAILWDGHDEEKNELKILDRIYGPSIIYDKVKSFAQELGYVYIGDSKSTAIVDIATDLDVEYPYMDNMCYLYFENDSYHLTDNDSYAYHIDNEYMTLQRTNGSLSYGTCECCGETIDHEDNAYYAGDTCLCEHCINENYVYVESREDYYHRDDTIYCECCERYEYDRSGEYIGRYEESVVCEDCYNDREMMEDNGFVYIESENTYYKKEDAEKCVCCDEYFLENDIDYIESIGVSVCNSCSEDTDKMEVIGYSFLSKQEEYVDSKLAAACESCYEVSLKKEMLQIDKYEYICECCSHDEIKTSNLGLVYYPPLNTLVKTVNGNPVNYKTSDCMLNF